MGIVIDNKDYLSTIISSLSFSLSSFASAQLAAARMFASTKTIEPDILMSLLMEEADRQRVQQACRASKKGTDEDKGEALASISNLTDSFFVVVQVKKAGKSGKVTSQKTQVSTSKKLTFF